MCRERPNLGHRSVYEGSEQTLPFEMEGAEPAWIFPDDYQRQASGKRQDSIRNLQEKAEAFRDARNWKQFHNPKDLAISISLEAAELLEVFQWSGTDLEVSGKRDKIREELADVFLYCGYLASDLDLDISEIVTEKLERNDRKYPIDKAYGTAKKYTEL